MYRKNPRPATIFERKYVEDNYQKAKDNVAKYKENLQKEWDNLPWLQKINIFNSKHIDLHSKLLFCNNYEETLNGIRSALKEPDYFELDIDDYKFVRCWANYVGEDEYE